MHDGMGFIAQHMAITSDFEVALQAVDPLVSDGWWWWMMGWWVLAVAGG